MKKSLGMLLILLLLISFTATCLAFPAPGKYEPKENIYSTMSIEIDRSTNTYFGKMSLEGKGVFLADWSAPLSIKKNNNGVYEIEVTYVGVGQQKMRAMWEIEQISNDSYKLYAVNSANGNRYFRWTWNKIN